MQTTRHFFYTLFILILFCFNQSVQASCNNDYLLSEDAGSSTERLVRMEACLILNADDETVFRVTGIHYLILAGEQAGDFLASMAEQAPEPWITGALKFVRTLKEIRRYEQTSDWTGMGWLENLQILLWKQQTQEALLFDEALTALQTLREQASDSLTLIWLQSELIRLKPQGGIWQTESLWQSWIDGKPDSEQALAKYLRTLHYPALLSENTITNHRGWLSLPGAAALSRAEQDRPAYISLPTGNVPPCPGSACSHHYSSTILSTHIREQEERQRQQINDAQRRLEEQSRESLRRSVEQTDRNHQRLLSEQQETYRQIEQRLRAEEQQHHQQLAMGVVAKTATKVLPRLSSTSMSVLKKFGHSLEELIASANQPINKEGLTKAARALTKHAAGQRATGTFPKLSGGISKQNETARKIVEDILNNPKSTYTRMSKGDLEVRTPDGRGLRYNKDGTFQGFVDP